MIANIASDDALILPYRANPAGLNFRERQGTRQGQQDYRNPLRVKGGDNWIVQHMNLDQLNEFIRAALSERPRVYDQSSSSGRPHFGARDADSYFEVMTVERQPESHSTLIPGSGVDRPVR
jgi:hypothetical protein